MKPRFLILVLLFLGNFMYAQVLEIEHLNVLADTVPFRFSGSPIEKNYSRYREIRIGCLNTGKNDLVFSGAKQSFTNDTSWLKVSDNVKFPSIIKPGAYGTISIIYSVFSPYQRIQILSNSRSGAQIITIRDTYKEPLNFKRDMKDYPAKLKEGELAIFSSTIENNGTKNIIIDSVFFPDPSLQLITKLPFKIPQGKSIPISLSAKTAGKKNFYYGGTPLFFYHPENGFEDFAKQEFSCIIIPNLSSKEKDTYDFGSVKRGTIISTTFHFTNNGSFTLESGKNLNDCITFDKATIAPGETFSVTVKYNTLLADSGIIEKEFPILLQPFFYSNNVKMKGSIKGPAIKKDKLLSTDQQTKDYGKISNDTVKTLKRDIKIKNNSGLPILINAVTTDEGSHAICDKKTSIEPGEYFIVTFVYNARTPGVFEKIITISYTPGECSSGEYYYTMTIKGNIITK